MITTVKLLVIDDDAADRLLLKRSLRTSGYDCELTECEDTITASQEILNKTFDCIFLDYLLPGDNGLLLLTKIRENGITTPIVIITSQGSERIAVELMKAGASDYVIKNQINGNSLNQILRNTLRINEAEREKEKALLALKLSEAKLAEAQRIAKIGNWEVDNIGGVVYWSPQVYQIFELTPDQFFPTLKNYSSLIDPAYRNLVYDALSKTLKGDNFNIDIKIIVDSGWRFVNAQGYAIISANKIQKLFGTIQDITDRKLAEQEILNARELAENSLKVRELFLANMSHEIRTPMNAILGFTQLLSETQLSNDQRSFVESIQFSGDNLLVIINDILDLSKIQSGKMTLEKIEFNLNDLVKGIINSLKRKAQDKSLQLTYDIALDVPYFIKGDPVRLNQILINLINNALKFTERGYVSLELKAQPLEKDNFLIEFSVKDTGIGIPKEKQSLIFESFVQASNETTRKYGGTGLGLTIVQNIVLLHEGAITMESSPGYGSTFYVKLPFEKADQEIVKIRDQQVVNDEPLHLLKRAHILVVEDNHLNQLLVKRVLDKTGCKADIVNNGLEAIESVKSGRYDIILMDLQMPEMDGYTATKYIRTNLASPLCNIPIIAMTAHALTSEVEKCIAIGMDDYISKPFKQEVLFSKIIKHLKKSDHLGIIPLHSEAISNYNIDPSSAVSQVDRNFISELMDIYDKQTPDLVEKLREALQLHNTEIIYSICCKVKSSYGIVRMPELNSVLNEAVNVIERNRPDEWGHLTTLINLIITFILAITEEVRKSVRKTGS